MEFPGFGGHAATRAWYGSRMLPPLWTSFYGVHESLGTRGIEQPREIVPADRAT